MMKHVTIILSVVLALGATARGDTADSPTKQAGDHFERGVSLYNETDYRAALVEFRRAYEIAPNAAVLYNLGQTYYQLQNYAAALTAFERYLSESGESPSHKTEVDEVLKTLRSRVGKVQISASLPDTEITIDDELVGKTPLTAAVGVSIGRRKVTALHAGRAAETRYVDVAAGETSKLAIELAPISPVLDATPGGAPLPVGPADTTHAPSRAGTVMWVTTGVLAAGAITTGIFAWRASKDLGDARNTFPVAPGTLDDKSQQVARFSLAADILASAAIIAGGFSLYLTLSRSDDHEVHAGLAPGGVLIGGTFK